MDERLRFVSRLLDGEAMTDVCREFGISRKTGYKIYHRYQKLGLEALRRVSDSLCASDPWRVDRQRIVVGKRSGKKMVNCA